MKALAVAAVAVVDLVVVFLVVLPLMDQRRDSTEQGAGEPRCPVVCGTADAGTNDVVVLIDALRADVWRNRSVFPRVAALRDNDRLWERQFVAAAPTVTLPRLEAIVTGREGSFLDLARNFGQDTMHDGAAVRCTDPQAQHDVLHALSCIRDDTTTPPLRNRRIAFYGDDTWLRLFPPVSGDDKGVFVESHGVTSFDVHDSTNVDNEVTSQLRLALHRMTDAAHVGQAPRVDLVWVHYLGYDHIGHVEDPAKSQRATAKLREMDDIVASTLYQLCSMHASSSVFVLSDHGMAVGGGHGGSSDEERSVFLARLGCSALPNGVAVLRRQEDALEQKWPQVDVGQHLLRGLSRKWPTGALCSAGCLLPGSRGLLSPSFDASCGSSVDDDQWESFLRSKQVQGQAAHTAEPTIQGTLSLMVVAIAMCTLCWLSAQQRHSKWQFVGLIVFALVNELVMKLSSSFVEESLYVNWGYVGGGVCWVIAFPPKRCIRRNAAVLLTCALMMRVAALGTFPVGVKWKTFAAMDGAQWRWMTLHQWLYQGSINATQSSSLLKLVLDGGFSPTMVAAAVALSLLLLRGAKRRAIAAAVAALATVPVLGALYWGVLVVIVVFTAVLMPYARRLQPVLFAVLVLVAAEAAHGALGRSMLVSDVTFSHLLGGSAASHPLLPVLGGVSVLLWIHAGRIVMYAAVVLHIHVDQKTLSTVRFGALLYASLSLCCSAAIAVLMSDHLFFWSVFLPSLLFKCGHVALELFFWTLV